MGRADWNDKLYKHYSKVFEWLGEEEASNAGSVLRNLHIISTMLARWQTPFLAKSLGKWKAKKARMIHAEIKERVRWTLDSSVGNLMHILSLSEGFEDEHKEPSILAGHSSFPRLPDERELFTNGKVSQDWLLFFKHLSRELIAFDQIQRDLLSNVFDLRALLFRGYLLAMTLHEALSIFDYALFCMEMRHYPRK